MKKVRKLSAILMVLVAVMSLVGCGKKNEMTTSTKATEAPTVKAEATAVPATEAPEATVKHEGSEPRTIKVGTWYDIFYDSRHTKPEDNASVGNIETAQMQIDNMRAIEEKYNIRLEFVNLTWQGTIDSINTSILAGTPDCDIYMTDQSFGVPAVLGGLAVPLEDFVPKDDDVFTTQTNMKKLNLFEDTNSFLFTSNALEQAGVGLAYNATLIDQLGMESPQDLYDRGEWTWDKFKEYLIATTKDNDGDGTTDVYGYGSIWTFTLNQLMLSNGGNLAGTMKEGLSSDKVVQTLEFMKDIHTTLKVARPWNAESWDDNLNAWKDGKVAFWGTQHWIQNGAKTEFNISIVPWPIGPSGDKETNSTMLVNSNWYFIPKGVEQPYLVYKVLYDWYNWYNGDVTLRDDTEWAQSCFETERDLNYILEISKKQTLDLWNNIGFDAGIPVLQIINGEATVSQAVEANKQLLQDKLDSIMKK